MRFHHRFRVSAPLTAVEQFHRRSSSMAAITPPPIVVRQHNTPEQLQPGDTMAFTMWLGPIPIRWEALIEPGETSGFVDTQLKGPFEEWVHTHTFVPLGPDLTEVRDDIHAVLKRSNFFHRVLGAVMWTGMPFLFAYRSWKTRRILAAGNSAMKAHHSKQESS